MHKLRRESLLFVSLIIVLLISSCGKSSNLVDESKSISNTAAEGSAVITADSGSSQANSTPQSNPTIAPPETYTVILTDGSEMEVPVAYTDFSALLEMKVAAGEWQYSQGLIEIMKLLTGEIDLSALPEAAQVQFFNGTGIFQMASEIISDQGKDPDAISELERLLKKVFPPTEILEKISEPANTMSSIAIKPNAMMDQQASEANCQNLAEQSFDEDYIQPDACYLIEERVVEGKTIRVFYPVWWQGQSEQGSLVSGALDALADSAKTFDIYGEFNDVDLMFSLLPYNAGPGQSSAAAFQDPNNTSVTCQITSFMVSIESTLDIFKQMISHEAYHCFQEWNFNYEPYSSNKWWVEGAAQYFSNVVYPLVNFEHRGLSWFDFNSRNTSLINMTYENFIFFQFYANKYGDADVINLQRTMADNDGSAESLASVSEMGADFQEFVVDYMSIGIRDTSGENIIVEHPAATDIQDIDQEGDKEFDIEAFVSARYGLKYKKENRFLQKPEQDGEGNYSMVKGSERTNRASWSGMPPELRSECKNDLIYVMAATTTHPESDFIMKASVTEVEKAVCDACLLGEWKIDNDIYEAYIMDVMASNGGMPDLPNGAELIFRVNGDNIVEFKKEGELVTKRDGFVISIGAGEQFLINTQIDSNGSGKYISDGNEIKVSNVVDVIDKISTNMNGLPISIDQTPFSTTYNFLGQSTTGDPVGLPEGPGSASISYVCKEKTLTLDQENFKEILLHRVVEILPTPVPTAGF